MGHHAGICHFFFFFFFFFYIYHSSKEATLHCDSNMQCKMRFLSLLSFSSRLVSLNRMLGAIHFFGGLFVKKDNTEV